MFKKTYQRDSNSENRGQDNDKIKRYVHSPFTIEHNESISARCDKEGRITIDVQEPGKTEYDQVVVPASLIFRLASMLQNTRKVRWMTPEEVKALGEAVKEE